jgi:SAM-dependent methyltransferase
MSVVEHGVPVRAFLEEAHRLLRPGGVLLLSTDYWPEATDTQGLRRYNDVTDVVFDGPGISRMLALARQVGFRVDAAEAPPAERALIHDEGLHYTFLYTEMEKA